MTTSHIKAGLLALAGAAAAASVAAPAQAQEAQYLAEFERPYGFAYGEESRAFDARTRDDLGNRVIIDGRLMNGSTLGGGLSTGWGQTDNMNGMLGFGSAVGNQLNVVTNGSWNTIIINSHQINNGDQTVVLNGELDLNDH